MSSSIYAISVCPETHNFIFFLAFDLVSQAFYSISFPLLPNLTVKLDILHISQPALSTLSAPVALQINRRK